MLLNYELWTDSLQPSNGTSPERRQIVLPKQPKDTQ